MKQEKEIEKEKVAPMTTATPGCSFCFYGPSDHSIHIAKDDKFLFVRQISSVIFCRRFPHPFFDVEVGPQFSVMRVHFVYITFICTARANLSFDRSVHLEDTTVAGTNDELNAFGVTGLNDGGVSHPQTDNDAQPVDETSPPLLAAGDSGDICKSSDTTRSVERRGCNTFGEPKDPTAPLKDFMDSLQRSAPPSSYWPLPTEYNPCKGSEASVCCEFFYQDVDGSWTVSLCYQC